MSLRDSLLDFDRPENTPFETPQGIVYIKAPTVKMRADIITIGKAHTKTPDLAKMTALSIIRCVMDENSKPLFQAVDMAALMDAPAGSWVDAVGARVMEMLTPNQDEVTENLDEMVNDS